MLTWNIANAEDLTAVNTDHDGTDDSVAGEPMKSSQMSNAAL